MSELVLTPYIQINGSWTLPDEVIRGLCRLMIKERTFKKVFYAGTVKNEDEFLSMCKSPSQHTVLITKDDGQPAGMVWVNNFSHVSAQAHFCMFRNIWGERTVEAALKTLDYLFGLKRDDEPLLRVILGITPAENELGINFVKDFGGKIIGTIPNLLWNYYEQHSMDAVISYVEGRN